MTEQLPPGERPEGQPPGGGPVDPSEQPPQQYPPPAQPGGYPQFPPPAQPGGYAQFPPSVPPGGYPPYAQQPPPPKGGRGSIWLGIGITIAVLLASWGLTVSVRYDSPLAPVTNLLAGGLPFALVLGGIVMAAIPRTTRTGAGILIGIGAGILIAGGLCFALVLGLGSGG